MKKLLRNRGLTWKGEFSYKGGGGSKLFLFFLIGIHSMQGLTATTRHGVTKKRSTKKITGNRKSVQKENTVKQCLLILDLKPLRS